MGSSKHDDIDEKAIIASFLPDEPENAAIPEPISEPPPREDTRRRKSREPDYETLFIRKVSITVRRGKMVYIRPEFHDTIQRITQVIGDNTLTLSGFIDNVLAHHFDTYADEISRLYDRKYKGVFAKNNNR